jgi:hypothetical protein
MNNSKTKLFIFTLPQEIVINENEKKLVCNIVVMPKYDPLLPLANIADGAPKDFVSFTESDIKFNAFLVKGNELLPTLINHNGDYIIAETALRAINPDRKEIFTQLSSFFQIKDKYGRGKVTTIPIKKYLPQAYRNAFGFAGARQGAVTDDSYFCALKENTFAPHNPPVDKDHVNWSQVMAFCLHQPELARQLGMLYRSVEMQLPSADYFKDGGWVYADVKEDTSYADLPGENIQRYAAWIPAVTKSRELFSPVLFPVEEAAAPETFDDIFDEVLRYNDGYAKIVHASQPVSTDHLGEQANGTAPVTDMGIRLAWDDEQVLEWYNRGFQSQGKIGTPEFKSDTPLVVSRYRLDVADITQLPDFFGDTDLLEKKAAWKSQVSVTADELKAGNIDLGSFKDELGVEVLPAKHGDKGDYWLPAYFTNWNGTGLCLPDPLPEKLNQLDEIKKELQIQKGRNPDDLHKVLYRQPVEDKVALKYGNEYAFRVRLSDISGGGPGPGTVSVNRGEHKIATQKFKRFVAPQPPAITAAAVEQSIIIERPRLNYPAIMFTNVNTDDAAAELLLDRANLIQLRADHANTPNRKWLREVSLPDPDVTQVEIVVEIKSPDMDRENSYHAINKILPKEPFIFLYKTFRKFPAYQLNHDRPDDVINLAFSYQDISLINFLAPDNELGLIGEIHSDNGPLLLPTAREIRLTIRSFCAGEKPDYFGSEASRISIPVIQTLRKDPVKLEEAILFKDPKDPLISIFFQPQSIITPQFREQQKTSGKANETNSDLLDRLCSITGLVHKTGSVSGNDNIRTQFGCSAVINHSISPDRSSITFSSRDDFYHKWINVIQLDLNRDWTWDLLKPDSFKVSRQWRLDGDELFQPKEELGGIFLTKGLNWQAMNEPDRSFTRLIFIDALDPKPAAGKFPEPLEVKYFIEPQFKQIKKDGVPADLEFDADLTVKKLSTLLPITTVPAQVPKIVSVGIALSPDSPDDLLIANRYAETAVRNRYLWIEFDKPPADDKDMYFGRVLAYSPDQMLAALDEELNGAQIIGGKLFKNSNPNWERDWKDHLVKEQTEPPINLDPETVRVVRPGQPFDLSGLEAMQAMIPANTAAGEKPVHFLLPLPPGIYPDSEELFGFFTYEFRVGHRDTLKWSTAQGRFGSPLRLTGVQHPAPPMLLSTIRDRDKVLVTTRHAQSFFQGKNVTPARPRTDIYACLYAQVLQADGIHYRNILIDKIVMLKPFFTIDMDEIEGYNKRKKDSEDISKPFTPPESPVLLPGTPPQAVGFWNMKLIREKLRFLGINENASLSVLTIELMPRNNFHNNEIPGPNFFVQPLPPQDLSLDEIRILRTSRLSPVMETCAVEV